MRSAGPSEPVVRGPHLVEKVRPELGRAFGSLALAVSRAGGAVGFLPDTPEDEIRAAADQAVDDVRADRQQMLTLEAGHGMGGAVFLRRGAGPRVAHRAEVLRLMVRPDLQGRGWGRRLLDAAVTQAGVLGLDQLLLSVRGGTDLPAFYLTQGWTQVGLFPGALLLGPGDLRDEHWFQLRLGRPSAS